MWSSTQHRDWQAWSVPHSYLMVPTATQYTRRHGIIAGEVAQTVSDFGLRNGKCLLPFNISFAGVHGAHTHKKAILIRSNELKEELC